MARPAEFVPGFDSFNTRFRAQVGIQLPVGFIEHVENNLKERGLTTNIQSAIKMALIMAFPVPGYEEETALVLKRFFGKENHDEIAERLLEANSSSREVAAPVEKSGRSFSVFGKKPPAVKEPIIEEGKEEPEHEIIGTGWKVRIESKPGKVVALLKSVDGDGEVIINEWTQREFYKTAVFFADQAHGLAALKYEELQLDRDDLENGLEVAMMKAFPEYSR